MANMSEEQLLEIYSDFYKYYSHEEFIEMMIDYEQRNQNQENLIKYLEDKIKKIKESLCNSKDVDDIKLFNYMKDLMLSIYTDLLGRIKNNYENSKN